MQIFQTDNSTRWKKFKWSLRVIIFILSLFIVALVISFSFDRKPEIPFRYDYSSVITASKPFLQETKLSKEYKGYRNAISVKKPHSDYEKLHAEHTHRAVAQKAQLTPRSGRMAEWAKMMGGIRSAFYVAWDPQSLTSLKNNIRHLNLIIPEWFFIDPKTDSLRLNMDPEGYKAMKRSKVPIMPILSNNFNREFHAEPVSRIFHDKAKRSHLIAQLVAYCKRHNFIGINIDFEELAESSNEPFVRFVKEISEAFHQAGLIVSVDIMPFNDDYNVKEMSNYADYFILMAYDEYYGGGDAGPISSQRWIEAAVAKIVKEIPAEKIILGLAGFGYDWPHPDNNDGSVTYQQALSRAKASNSTINFDNNTYNLTYGYQDDKGTKHQVYFTDAATSFNTMRFGVESGMAGFALWRLGSEDWRMWRYYRHDLALPQVRNFDFKRLEFIPENKRNVDYVGDGEILDVINAPHPGKVAMEIDSTSMLIAEEKYVEIPSDYQIHKLGAADPKKLVLTFDDGPSAEFTPKILDILKSRNVPAAFFIVGLEAEQNLPLLKRIFKEGYEIGNHTFTHPNIAKVSRAEALRELKLTRLLLESVTGHSTILFRAPYNADSEPVTQEEVIPVMLAREQNYLDIGENIDPEDWQPGISADTIIARVIDAVHKEKGNIILLHDAGGDSREATVKALPVIIDSLHKEGYTFTTISGLLNKPKDVLMPPVPRDHTYYALQSNMILANIFFALGRFLAALFIIFVTLGIIRLAFMVVWAIIEKRKERRSHQLTKHDTLISYPKVSIIVPAYNEEINAVSSLKNLLKQDYPNFDIVFVDDGSKDSTYNSVASKFDSHHKVKVYTKPNGGKASALNYGIEHSDAEYVVCIDADTKLYSTALSLLMSHFVGENATSDVGAVAGYVKVGNRINMMTTWQSIEYTTSQNFDRMAYAHINAITVVPGAIGAFKRSVIAEVGGFTVDTLAEDCDLTIRILRAGYKIENENRAVAVTEAPETVKQFVKQRTRWSFGVLQTFWKHRDTLFNPRYKGLGMWAMPNMLIFQFIIPTFSPLADLLMLLGIFMGNGEKILLYYIIFTIVDCSISVAAFIIEREKLRKLLWLIPQRFVYRWIMYVVLFKSYHKAIKGELQNWGVLKRTGHVADV